MNEKDQQPNKHVPQVPEGGPWDASEQVGDVYEVDVSPDGQIERAERLYARPQIWVGSWLDYNNGILHGDWIPADRDDAEIWTDIQTMLAHSPTATQTGEVAEEWGIFDSDNFGPLRIGEQESIAWVAKVARGITEHGPAFAAWADVMQDEALLDGFTDAYLGHYESVDAYANQLVDDLGYQEQIDQALPDSLRAYVRFDTAGLARDMQIGGDIHVVNADDGGIWIFDAR